MTSPTSATIRWAAALNSSDPNSSERNPMFELKSLRTASLVLLVCAAACDQAPADVREWTPADHKGETQNPERTGQTAAAPSDAPAGLDEVTIATWSNNCTTCHGQVGQGNGPQAAMTKPRDLTDAKWQASVTDEQIANVIVQGKGLMPKFTFPPSTVQSLVQLVRRLAAVPQAQAAAAAAPGAAAAPSAGAHVSPSPQAATNTARTPPPAASGSTRAPAPAHTP